MLSKVIDSPDLIEIGKKIRDRRIKLGLSQKELAAAVDISYNTVSRIESAQSSCSIESFLTMADILKVTPNELSPARFRYSSSKSPLSALDTKFAQLSPANQQLVLQSMSALLDGFIAQQSADM